MTATDELCRLLDGRGVEWQDFDDEPTWMGSDGEMHYARQEFTFNGLTGNVTVYHLTPEQAVEATLGSDLKAENAKLRELVHIAGTYCVNGMCGKDDGCPLYLGKPYCALPDRMRELGVEE